MKSLLLIGLTIFALAGYTLVHLQAPSAKVSSKPTYHQHMENIASKVNGAKLNWKAHTNTRWEGMTLEAIKGQMGVL